MRSGLSNFLFRKEDETLTDKKHRSCCCPHPHQRTQPAPYISAWVRETLSPKVCPQPVPSLTCYESGKTLKQIVCRQPVPSVTPNPSFSSTATLPMCTPLQLKKIGPETILVTVSIPAESIITLPTDALEVKMIRKHLKITQSRFFNSVCSPPGIPPDTSKLFLGGFVRKDIQYSQAVRKTSTTVEGVIKDFVVDIPISCVIDLGKHFIFPPVHYDQQREYGFARSTPLPSGFSSKDQMLSSDFTEFNVISQQFYNPLPISQLLYSQINEMDDALDWSHLHCGPFEEGSFRTLQEKMTILIQLKLTFPSPLDTYCDGRDNHYEDNHDEACQLWEDNQTSEHWKPDHDCKHHNIKLDYCLDLLKILFKAIIDKKRIK